jgi:hypothetical protein
MEKIMVDREQMKQSIKEHINSMSKEELEKSLKDAGIDFYKNIKTKIFSPRPDYRGLWYDLYEIACGQAHVNNPYLKNIMEEMDPSINDDFEEECKPQQVVRLGERCCGSYAESTSDPSSCYDEYWVTYDRHGQQIGKAVCAGCGKETDEKFTD